MKFKSPVYSQASGSIAGITYSHNRGGMYTRQRVIPVDPGSTFQMTVRQLMATLTAAWLNTLTSAQRDHWDAYAAAVKIPDRLGEPRNIGGLGMYARCNIPLIQAGGTRVDDGPTTLTLPQFTAPSFGNISAGAGTVDVTFDNTDDWAGEDGGYMTVLASRGMNITRNYFKGPYRFMDKVEGDAVTPPTSPQSMTLPFAVVSGQRVHFQARVIRADGRVSLPFRGYDTAAA